MAVTISKKRFYFDPLFECNNYVKYAFLVIQFYHKRRLLAAFFSKSSTYSFKVALRFTSHRIDYTALTTLKKEAIFQSETDSAAIGQGMHVSHMNMEQQELEKKGREDGKI